MWGDKVHTIRGKYTKNQLKFNLVKFTFLNTLL